MKGQMTMAKHGGMPRMRGRAMRNPVVERTMKPRETPKERMLRLLYGPKCDCAGPYEGCTNPRCEGGPRDSR